MKHLIFNIAKVVMFLSIFTFLACTKDDLGLKVVDWGPQAMVLGDIPNKQPDGGLGIWIQVSGEPKLGELQIVFDGQPQSTAVHEKLITASVSPKLLLQAGSKEITVKQVSTGRTSPVGVFIINSQK